MHRPRTDTNHTEVVRMNPESIQKTCLKVQYGTDGRLVGAAIVLNAEVIEGLVRDGAEELLAEAFQVPSGVHVEIVGG